MKTKENKTKITLKKIILAAFGFFAVIYILIFYNMYFATNKSYATEASAQAEELKISNANEINLDEIIAKNTNNGYTEEITKKEEVLEYLTQYRTNKDIPKGVSYVVQEGGQGVQEITIKTVYNENGEKVSEEQIDAEVVKSSY